MSDPVNSVSAPAENLQLNIGEILKLLPHRYPMLLLDRVIEIVRAKRIVAIKNVTINEPFFNGHFPEFPIMPGVLIVEAMAQAGALGNRNEDRRRAADPWIEARGDVTAFVADFGEALPACRLRDDDDALALAETGARRALRGCST